MFRVISGPFFNMEETGAGDGSQPGKTFTQEEVDRIIGERLAREKSSKVDYDDYKEIAELVQGYGYQGTPAEIKAALRAEQEQRRKADELKDLEEEAATSGTSPELLAEIKALKKELDDMKKETQKEKSEREAREKANEDWNNQIKDFQGKYPDIDVEKLGKNEKFIGFLNRTKINVPLIDAYETYIELVGDAEKAAIEKINANAERSTSSGRQKGDPSGGTYGLSESQQKLARDNGISFKDYSDRLKDIT